MNRTIIHILSLCMLKTRCVINNYIFCLLTLTLKLIYKSDKNLFPEFFDRCIKKHYSVEPLENRAF